MSVKKQEKKEKKNVSQLCDSDIKIAYSTSGATKSSICHLITQQFKQ